MKRELLKNVKVIPYTPGGVLHRLGFLSAILGIKIESITGDPTACKMNVKIEHGDDEKGNFTPVDDTMIALGEPPMSKEVGTLKEITVEAGETVNLALDLIGCKEFVKIMVEFAFEGGTSEGGTSPAAICKCAVALGDRSYSPA